MSSRLHNLPHVPSFSPPQFGGCLCCYNGCDLSDIKPGCRGQAEELCLVTKCCCLQNEKPFSVGLFKEESLLCGVSLPCCQLGLKVPDKCVQGQMQCLCVRGGAALPLGGPVPSPVCACCAFQLLPEVGFMKPFPEQVAFAAPAEAKMERV